MTTLLIISPVDDLTGRVTAACAAEMADDAVRVTYASPGPSSSGALAAAVRRAGVSAPPACVPLTPTLLVGADVVVRLGPEPAAGMNRGPTGIPAAIRWEPPEMPDASRAGAVERLVDWARARLDALLHDGQLQAIASTAAFAEILGATVWDCVLAHDLQRRIVYFNDAAETLIGRRRGEVLGRDCHEIFPGRLCGGKCRFCDMPVQRLSGWEDEARLLTAAGEERSVDVRARAFNGADGTPAGVVVAFRDRTRERDLARRVGEECAFAGLVGRDSKMREIYALIRDVADADAPVLVQGESGTGKELVAAAIHGESARGAALFVPVNCGALPEALLESELFGHVKGAFTGALRDKKGRFELAHGGTIFLDEIGDISPAVQVKLLRVLQDGCFQRVGGEETIRVEVRVVSATNRDLAEEIRHGRFREDLYYRIGVVPMWLPPLRERRGDIPLLAMHILKRFVDAAGRRPVELTDAALDVLLDYSWPGNVRELQNWIQFALVKCKTDRIGVEHLPPAARWPRPEQPRRRRRKLDVERVRTALRETGGNKRRAATLLGVGRATLYRFLADIGG